MGTDRLARKSDRRVAPLFPNPLFFSGPVGCTCTRVRVRDPMSERARKEGRKAEGADKGGNWTNQFTVFEIRLPRPTGPSDVQRVQGCVRACMARHTDGGQSAREYPRCRSVVVKPLYDADSSLLLYRNKGLRGETGRWPSSASCDRAIESLSAKQNQTRLPSITFNREKEIRLSRVIAQNVCLYRNKEN